MPFENREKEMELMLNACLTNRRFFYSRLSDDSEMSTHKPILIISCQMWGSGKSWFGYHFLKQLRIRIPNTIQEKMNTHPQEMNDVLNAIYVQINFKFIPNPMDSLIIGIRRAIVDAISKYHLDYVSHLNNEPIDKWTLPYIFNEIKKNMQLPFLLSF